MTLGIGVAVGVGVTVCVGVELGVGVGYSEDEAAPLEQQPVLTGVALAARIQSLRAQQA